MKISDILSSVKNFSPSHYCTTWMGRRVTFAALGALSVAVVAFIFKMVFSKKPEDASESEPLTPERAQGTPRTPFSARSYTLQTLSALRTPHTIRTKSRDIVSGDEEVFTHSQISENRYPCMISVGSFIKTIKQDEEIISGLKDVFTNASLIYVQDNLVISIQNIATAFPSTWNDLEKQRVFEFLLQLSNIGKEGIQALYPQVSIESELLTNGPIHCSISKKDDGKIMIVLNNLLYSHNDLVYQLYLIVDEINQEKAEWQVNVYCTTSSQQKLHPVKLDTEEMTLFHHMDPFSDEHVCVDYSRLGRSQSVTINHLDTSLDPVFNFSKLKEVCGELVGLQQLNNLPLLKKLLPYTVPDALLAETAVLCEPPQPKIYKEGSKIFLYFFLKTEDGKLFEVGFSMKLNTEWKFFGPKKLTSVTLEKGFYAEWMKTTEREHPLVTLFKDPEESQSPDDSVSRFPSFPMGRTPQTHPLPESKEEDS